MPETSSRPWSRHALVATLLGATLLGGCAEPQPRAMGREHPKEYFSEKAYGVKASPRLSFLKSHLPRGGGRDQTGQPYKVAGKWYYPKEDKRYRKVGAASWYGDAFHGRLTANGELYDMTHLTAAHPTMPLPSYARVTNLTNGSSVIVRVNDRGPFADGRIIDLSKRAAEMLDYAHGGVARVEVDYIGRAPLDGQDDRYLMASYKPGGGDVVPGNDGLPEGVMVAMNGPTPTSDVVAAPFPGELRDSASTGSVRALQASFAPFDGLALPDVGPEVPERPGNLYVLSAPATNPLSYAEDRFGRSAGALATLASGGLTPDAVAQSWTRTHPADPQPYIAVGTFADKAEAQAKADALSALGRVALHKESDQGGDWWTVTAAEDGRADLDALLEGAWSAGAADAIVVRD